MTKADTNLVLCSGLRCSLLSGFSLCFEALDWR